MKKVLGIIVFSLFLNGTSYAKIKSKDITFPGKYFTKEIKACSAIPNDKSFSNQSAIDTVKGVVGFDWSKYHTENSNSILVQHTAITTLMEIVTGVKLEHDPIYLRKRKMHTPDGIDDLIGFNPNCI